MQRRRLGGTDLHVSVLGFGCGTVSGLMVRGSAGEQARAVGRAVELGINYFDTAAAYGEGASEENLGRALKSAGPDVLVGTKVRVAPETERGRIGAAVAAALEESSKRLGRERVDLVQLHNVIARKAGGRELDAAAILEEVAPALRVLCRQGKARFCGLTALGDTAAIREVIQSGQLDTAQVVYNLLNPSAAGPVPAGFPGQDYGGLLAETKAAGMGTLGIRVLAGGALAAEGVRHPLAKAEVDPMGSGSTFAADVRRARRLDQLVTEGHAGSLAEAALCYAIGCNGLSMVVIGASSVEQLEMAVAAAAKGPLDAAALDRIAAVQSTFAGEPR